MDNYLIKERGCYYMGIIVDEGKYIRDNVLLHEDRMGSQLSRFLDKSPSYVRYFHINNNLSMADEGLENVERMLGRNSPIRFDEIKDFPIYGIDQIVIDLNIEDVGVDGSFDGGEGILLPNTIKPLPGDYFIINYLDKNVLFQVTEIKYDTIKSNNFYKISFSLKSTNPEKITDLERQTVERYSCVTDNVGSDEHVIVKNTLLAQMRELNKVYLNIQKSYLDIFYNKKYNVLLFEESSGMQIYDRYQTHFINKHSILNSPKSYTTIRLSDEDNIRSSLFNKHYKNTIYRAIEERDSSWMKQTEFTTSGVTHKESIFTLYSDRTIESVDLIGVGGKTYTDSDFFERIMNPPKPLEPDEYKVINKEPESVITSTNEPEPIIEPPVEIVMEKKVNTIRPSHKDGDDIVFNPEWYRESELEEEPLDDLITNESDSYDPIPEPEEPPLVEIPETTPVVKAEYENVVEDYIIQFIEGKFRDPEDLCLSELNELARDMEDDWSTFVNTPILLFVIGRTLEKLAQ